MTCSACHTGEFTYSNRRVRIDGAPTLADFQGLVESMLASLVATRADDQKLDRFVNAILGAGASVNDRTKLIGDLDGQISWYTRLMAKNTANNTASIRYGHGRLDGQGYIRNKIALNVGAVEPLIVFPSEAPASYPFVWTTPQQTPAVQWNGIAPQPLGNLTFHGKSYDSGAMIRNITELVGVFGSLDVGIEEGKQGYASSLRMETMIDLENLVKRLKSPRWPQNILPPINKTLSDEGRALFSKHKCHECHSVLDPAAEPPQGTINATMTSLTDIGTDIWLACNTYLHQSKSGLLEGRDSLTGPIAKIALTSDLLANAGVNILNRSQSEPPPEPTKSAPGDVGQASAKSAIAPNPRIGDVRAFDDPVRNERAQRCRSESDPRLAYKAGPLNGIWATAPYLHNGSVPTLYELLLPPAKRKTVFWVGGVEFDPVDVGFKSGPGSGPFEFRVRDGRGKVIPGNDNAGHDYGTASMSERERRALVEYLKTL